MSAALDVNTLLYASDDASPFHGPATQFLQRIATGSDLVYLFWPTVMAYLRIATHPSIFSEPLSPEEAMQNVEGFLALPHVRSPGEHEGFWPAYRAAGEGVVLRGNVVPNAHVVALMRLYGVDAIWTRDRDYTKFRRIRVLDPFA